MKDYTGLILVSHSEKIAKGTKELIREVITDVPIELAAGEVDGGIGTNPDRILTAIQKLATKTKKGVLIFYDLGSAKMNSELAIELSGLENVFIAEAPLVEGAYVGAVEAFQGKEAGEILQTIEKSF